MGPSRDTMATVFEGAPRFIERLAQENVNTWPELFERAERIVHDMPEDEQLELLNAHPRIGAPAASLSTMSYREQGYERDPATLELQSRLERLNAEYEARFGFRFVVFVNGRSRAVIADMLESRVRAPRQEELERGLSDVVAIARDRQRRMEEQ